ncbi:MAG: hypothetical protein AAF513_04255 [Pseudomonadota bacterium]
MSNYWKRFKFNQTVLPTAVTSAVLVGICLLFVWARPVDQNEHMQRFGTVLATTIAKTSATHLLNNQRIELAVLANDTTQHPEVAGIVFYNINNEVIALHGRNDLNSSYPATITAEDAIIGYVNLFLEPTAFAPPARLQQWLLSVLSILLAPFVVLLGVQLSQRGNRSLPIVSVPEQPHSPQLCFCLFVNLHNQIALSRDERRAALEDALAMAEEVCAIHQGVALTADDRGVLVLLDQTVITAAQAICASLLLQDLLHEFETDGKFRCYLDEYLAPDNPTELNAADLTEIYAEEGFDSGWLLAALARSQTAQLSAAVRAKHLPHQQSRAEAFEHPLLSDIAPHADVFLIAELPEQQAQLIVNQGQLILGFSQAAG